MRRRGGPVPHRRLNTAVAAEQGRQAFEMHQFGHGLTFAQIGQHLGISTSTAWRRYWLYETWVALPAHYGHAPGPRPPQRGTARCPRGRPCIATLDHPELQRPANRPGVHCSAQRKHGRGPCGNYAIHGGQVCRIHGGAAPQVRRAAAERHAANLRLRAAVAEQHRHH